uniref:VWFA domain-containing protein n=1 Tax=Caenorhabditis tropicalis TaxID=1561998 RepID=A0A1I7U079_9PELO
MAWEEGDDLAYTSPGVPKRNVQWYLLEDADSRIKWFTGILVLVSIGMLIAGSVMLGVGISKNNSSPPIPVNSPDTGYTMFLSVQTRALPYTAVVNDYSGSVQNLTNQMQQAITPASSGSQLAIQPNVPITILGISNAGQWADVMYALSYTTSNKPAISDIQKRVTDSGNFAMISATDQTPPSLNQMSCSSVSDSALTTTVGPSGTPITPCGTVPTHPTNPAPTGTSSVATVTSVPGQTTTTASPFTGTTLTPPTAPVTQPARTTTTAFVKTPYSRDVIILLDDSKAMLTAKNFNTVKSWIDNTLLPLWLIDREDVQVAFATYADTEFNILLDFDEADESEVVSVISAQMYSGKFNSSITNGIRAAGGIHGLRPVNQTVIFISASEDLTDIESATQYAYIINTLPKQLITISLNSVTSGKQLGLLSTNQNHFFGVPDFNLTADIAQQLTQYMFGTLTPSTSAPTTTAVPDNSCKTDVTILMDNNNDVGSADEFQNQVRTISKLIKTWPISPELMEGEAVVFATTEGGQIIENPFAYQSASAFANEVMAFDDFYFANSPPSLTASLKYLSQNLFTRRTGREQTTIVFTYSSDNSDVQSAVEFANHIGGNLIVVAIGNADQTVLKQLSGNVIYSKNTTTDIIDQINNVICLPTTRAPLATTTPMQSTSGPTSTPVPSTVTTVATTQTPVITTPLPDPCPDCSPKTANILLLLEAFGDALASQKKLVETDLISTWNHFERTSIMGFDTLTKNLDPINFGDLQNKDEFVGIADSLTPFADQPTIVSAFTLAVKRAQPLKTFGKMNSIIFTSGATADEITASTDYSKTLRTNGKVIIVGLKLKSVDGLSNLCDTLLKWDDFTDTAAISTQINQSLNN